MPSFDLANQVLTAFRAHPAAWRRVDAILDKCTSDDARIIAAGVLEDTIKFKWSSLTDPDRGSIRNFVATKIIALSSDAATATREAVFLNKLNLLLVEVLKQDWPHKWPTFIDEIAAASKRLGDSLCANNMRILTILSEEVFDFGTGPMTELTSARQARLREAMSAELRKIFDLFAHAAATTADVTTVKETLRALSGYLTWIPAEFVFETNLVDTLIGKFLPAGAFRTVTLDCLAEVADADGSEAPKYASQIQEMFGAVIANITKVIPPGADIAAAVRTAKAAGSQTEPRLVHRLTLFLSAVFRRHLRVLESADALQPLVLQGLAYLLSATRVDDKDLRKLIIEFWRDLARDLFDTAAAAVREAGGESAAMAAFTACIGAGGAAGSASAGGDSAQAAALSGAMAAHPRVMQYSRLLSALRLVGVELMPKPEEVLVEVDARGDVVRTRTKNTDGLAQYEVMREMMVYLTHLDPADTERIIVAKLARQADGSEWGWDPLNAMCWAAGAVSGTMTAEHEKTFLIAVIRDLLRLVEIHSQKNNKAVVASNIMFIVGQYPRFLSGHWRFLKTVVYKLFEFMHEMHEGVRDMACDTFLKLAKRCAPSFVVLQEGESRSFVEELSNNVRTIISHLEPHQVQAFYEAAGCMVSAFPNEAGKEALCDTLLTLPREALDAHVASAAASLDALRSPDVMRDLGRIFAIYERVARAVGRGFARHAASVFLTVLGIYRAYSGFVSTGAAAMGSMATSMADGAGLQSVRRAVLGFLRAFVRNCGDRSLLMDHFLPRLAGTGAGGEVCMLDSFGAEAPAARLPELLDLFHAVALALKGEGATGMAALVPKLLQPAVELISHNYSDHPEMRHSLYRLTQVLSRHCPAALLAMTPSQQKLFLDTLLWGIKHEDPFVAERACLALRDLLSAVAEAGGAHANAFFSAFLLSILQDVLFVLTDRMHKAQFVLHVELLRGLFAVVNNSAVLPSPIWDEARSPQPPGSTNAAYVFNHVGSLLARAFPNVDSAKVAAFVRGLGTAGADVAAYRTGVRDFLIESLSFSVSSSHELWRAEQAAKAASEQTRKAAVPGLTKQSSQPALGMHPSQAQAASMAAAGGTEATMAALDAIAEDF